METTKTSKTAKLSTKTKTLVKEEQDEGFLVALLADPVGRKVVLFVSVAWLLGPMYLLGRDFFWIMLVALFMTGLITFPILHYVCHIDLKVYLKHLVYGAPVVKKKD